MKLVVTTVIFAMFLASCSGGTGGGATDGTDDVAGLVMAAALHQLVTVDHTFGQGPSPFTEYLIQERLDSAAGDGTRSGELRMLTESERASIEEAIVSLGAVRWIGDPDDFRTPDLMPKVEGGVILGVGEPSIAGDKATVPVSLWCGGLCGTWLTYQVTHVDGVWEVTGTEGPIAIS